MTRRCQRTVLPAELLTDDGVNMSDAGQFAVLTEIGWFDVTGTLVTAAAKGFVLLSLAALCCQMLRRASAAARHLVWATSLAVVLLIPALSQVLPHSALLPSWMGTAHASDAESLSKSVPFSGRSSVDSFAGPETRSPATSHGATHAGGAELGGPVDSAGVQPDLGRSQGRESQSWAALLMTIWACGLALMSAPLALGWWANLRLATSCPQATSGDLFEQVAGVADELGMRPPRLHVGDDDAMPMVWGIFRPRLLLPAVAASWNSVRLRAVLLHELAHLQRRDLPAMLFGQLARAVHWFNPLAWLAVRQLRIEREQACDDVVLRSGVKPSDYADSLLNLVVNPASPRVSSAALCMAEPGRIEDRVQRVLDSTPNRKPVSRRLLALTSAAAGFVAVSLSIVQAASQPDRSTQPIGAGEAAEQTPVDDDAPASDVDVTTVTEGENFFVFPVTTDLQRRLVSFGPGKEVPDAKAYVLVDGMSVIRAEETIDSAAINLDRIRDALKPYRNRKKGVVFFRVYYGRSEPRGAKELLMWALQGFGKHAGFESSRVSNTYLGEGFDWEEMINGIRASIGDAADGPEPMVGDDTVQVFPVRTRLSRYLAGDADCVVDVLQPIDGADGKTLPPETCEAIVSFVSELKLSRREKLLIRVHSVGNSGQEAVDKLVEARRTLQDFFDFETVAISNTRR